MSRRFVPLLLVLPMLGCDPKGDDSDAPETGVEDSEPVGDATFEQLLYVDDGPGDLDLSADGRVLVVTRYGGHVLAWTPGSDGTDTVERSIAGLEGIWVRGGETIWAASSDGGIVGAVGALEDSELQAIATQADDGTLFRYPRDLALAPDGRLVMVDATVAALFVTDPKTGATSWSPLAIASPRRLLFVGETLYVGGSDGIYQVGYPDGASTRVDEREAWGLLEHEGTILATNDEAKVFELGGASLGGAEIGRPGGMVVLDGTLYVSDLVGSYVYGLALAD
jgi:hypothetical protein